MLSENPLEQKPENSTNQIDVEHSVRNFLIGFILFVGLLSGFAYVLHKEQIKTYKAERELFRRDSIETYVKHIEDVLVLNFTDLDKIQAHGFARPLYEAADKYSIDWELEASIIYYESGWNPGSENPESGCAGLNQFCIETATRMGDKVGIEKLSRRDPFESIIMGACYLRELQDTKISLDSLIKIYVGDKTNTSIAAKYRGGVKADYNRMKRMK